MRRFALVTTLAVVSAASPTAGSSRVDGIIARLNGLDSSVRDRWTTFATSASATLQAIGDLAAGGGEANDRRRLFGGGGIPGVPSDLQGWAVSMYFIYSGVTSGTITSFDAVMSKRTNRPRARCVSHPSVLTHVLASRRVPLAPTGQFQSASCSAGSPKPDIPQGIATLIENLIKGLDPAGLPPGIDGVLTTEVESLFSCLCSGSWDFSAPEWAALFATLRPQITEPSTKNAEALLDALKAAVPHLFSSGALCGSKCMDALESVVHAGLTMVQSTSGQTLPSAVVSGFPRASIGCMCQTPGLWSGLTALISNDDLQMLFEGDMPTDKLLALLSEVGSFYLDSICASGQCKAAFEYAIMLGGITEVARLWPPPELNATAFLVPPTAAQRPTVADMEGASAVSMECSEPSVIPPSPSVPP
jgi:hypothetical protein